MAGAMDKDEIAHVRALPLEAVLQRLGATRDPKDPARNWRLGASRITGGALDFAAVTPGRNTPYFPRNFEAPAVRD